MWTILVKPSTMICCWNQLPEVKRIESIFKLFSFCSSYFGSDKNYFGLDNNHFGSDMNYFGWLTIILGWIRMILDWIRKPGLKTSSRCSGLCAQSPPSHKNHFKTQGSRTTNPLGIFLFAATELWSAMIRMTVNEVITLTLVRSTLMSSAESVHSSVPVSKLGRNPIPKCTCHV